MSFVRDIPYFMGYEPPFPNGKTFDNNNNANEIAPLVLVCRDEPQKVVDFLDKVKRPTCFKIPKGF